MPHSRLLALAIRTLVIGLVGCGASKSPGAGTLESGETGVHFETGTSVEGGVGFDASGFETGPVGTDCTDDSLKQIYVVTQQNQLYQFAPATLTFTLIGTLDCPSSPLSTPYSMAVDRSGTAWIVFSPDGNVYNASTKTAHCTASGYTAGQGGYTTFGMAFVSDTVGSAAETLYVSPDDNSGTGKGIAKIDTSTKVLTYIGNFDQTLGPMDLTGRGDARFFGFANGELASPVQPTKVAEIDKSSGHILGVKVVPGVTVGDAWAFAQWGGNFWLFHDPNSDGNSSVTKFTYETGAALVAKSNLGFSIVGAGVSTCAPTTTIN
ncbi:MAG: hypothetical protein ACHREM_14515 [Polyangiales bacterium]